MKINPNFEILLSYWSTFEFIFKFWHGKKKMILNEALLPLNKFGITFGKYLVKNSIQKSFYPIVPYIYKHFWMMAVEFHSMWSGNSARTMHDKLY